MNNLEEESKSLEKLLKGKVVEKVFRHRENEFGIEFTDGTRLFVDQSRRGMELSITGGKNKE